jgi:diguanylate cyclase (GGDEF)-like protein
MRQAWTATRDFLIAMFAPRADPYEGADLATSRRVTGALLGLSTLLALAFFPIDPPSDAIGWAGWIVAGALVVSAVLGVRRIADRARPLSFEALLGVAYAGVVGTALLQWLAGPTSPYRLLLVLWLGAGAVHPPRRAFAHLAALIAALAAPLAYEGYDSAVAADIAAEALLIFAIGLVLSTYLFHVRRQRAGLEAGAEVARRLARVDPLTGLGNRRAFDEALTIEIARSEREREPLSVGLVDLDSLKRINDRLGHLEGDRCLRETARAMERTLRSTDLCFRWGGDEFAVVLPATDRATADRVLARMERDIGRVGVDVDGEGLTLTFGLAELAPGATPEDLLTMADLALMEQKTEKRR